MRLNQVAILEQDGDAGAAQFGPVAFIELMTGRDRIPAAGPYRTQQAAEKTQKRTLTIPKVR